MMEQVATNPSLLLGLVLLPPILSGTWLRERRQEITEWNRRSTRASVCQTFELRLRFSPASPIRPAISSGAEAGRGTAETGGAT